MNNLNPNRILSTPSEYAKENLLYVQEIGTLTSRSPHISTRKNIFSFLFLVVISGSGTFSYKGKSLTIHTGDCIFINCEEPYSHESSESDPWTLTWVHFYGKRLYKVYKQYMESGYTYRFHPESLTEFLTSLSELYHIQAERNALTEILSNKFLTDIITLSFTANTHENKESVTTIEKLQAIREYMLLNFAEKISLDTLSAKFYISKFHLSREYKHYFGVNLLKDLTSIRVSQAKSLLRFTTKSVEEISEDCGFSDSGYFIKVFKSTENMTPFTYRTKW